MNIQSLLLNAHNVDALFDFYVGKLELAGAMMDGQLLLKLPGSKLKFEQTEKIHQYHFAFNIPFGSIKACYEWLSQHVDIIPFEEEEIIYLDNWNAYSLYCLDPCENIIEFIERKEALPFEYDSFSPQRDVLNISEIGCPVQSIPTLREGIKEVNLPLYSGGDEYFVALGNEEGLLVCPDDQKDFWFPTKYKPKAAPFNITIQSNNQAFNGSFNEYLSFTKS